jgi:hypothetical protein
MTTGEAGDRRRRAVRRRIREVLAIRRADAAAGLRVAALPPASAKRRRDR